MTETPDSRVGRRNMTTDVPACTGERRSVPTQRMALRPNQAGADAIATRLLAARSSRFALNADHDSATGAQRTGGMLLRTLFFRGCVDPRAEVTVNRALTCLAELAGSAAARQSRGSTLWCQIWMDDEHVFVAVEEDTSPAFTAPERVLHSAHVLTDDCGSTVLPDGFQTWAAVRRLD
ncbi:hypothetical protein ACIQ9R_36280 [Streptomyces sp. NPDC094447]|uniref:hypothetical protein n=1 Tax=Streptomyces sp. NPDC094447 TaxID=3366062 RepID=UPI0038100560